MYILISEKRGYRRYIQAATILNQNITTNPLDMATTQSNLNNQAMSNTKIPNGNSKRHVGGGDADGEELLAAAVAGDIGRLRQLISNGANVNYRN